MAVYKVPQDVEAEDKLIGPFSFRQFIYLIVAALGIFLAWALSRVFIGLLILPLPIVIAMLALALPLRKDQPMETYLIAMIKFFFKPRHRIWDPEGTMSLVQITAPQVIEGPQLKDVGGEEASQRLAYLSQIVDTQGWASRGVTTANGQMDDIFIADASKAEDVLDDTSSIAQALNQRITQSDDNRMQNIKQQFQASVQQAPEPAVDAAVSSTQPTTTDDNVSTAPQVVSNSPSSVPKYNPYPSSIRQRVLSPSDGQPSITGVRTAQMADNQPSTANMTQSASDNTVSPDIIRLANNNDLSISAIAREAERLKSDDDEVVINLH